ncbi:hypothetical protein HYPSUDRAFT_70279 [Hypholoma sublateritium FD-334 SS-4]|uniref:MSP domain-containing protein n=1 Tax=Hypholoma sublateritium (strain FD-334 SS-4) TaxID=945553 RepID=A0A0D2NMQ9_HYPSF|nr:hypothetical protein HYPSUDRAFT_70279 [Hypholoma sublateritium FD-334 SS-4]
MSVSLSPSNALGFKRPLTTLVKRSLTITNNNPQPVAFKVKTTAPKLYCVRPNSGRVEPGESIDVSVMLQALKEEPPLNTKCKDKFLIQSTIITPDKENLALHDIWASPEANEEGKVFQQKLRVTYLPAEGQTLEEEDEPAPVPAQSVLSNTDTAYDTVRAPGNGHAAAPAPAGVPVETHFASASSQSQDPAHDFNARAPTPPLADESMYDNEHSLRGEPVYSIYGRPEDAEPEYVAQAPPVDAAPSPGPVGRELTPEPSHYHAAAEQEHEPEPEPAPVPSQEHTFAPAPAPEPIYITRENPVNEEMFAKFNMAQAEIERLKAQLAALTAQSQSQSELRRRTRRLSDADSAAGADALTAVEDAHVQPEGVPLQVVVVIALGVFVTTYLFF